MKPWFVKEAEVIKFPEPEKKVVHGPDTQVHEEGKFRDSLVLERGGSF